jgi:regulator of RNase E activity RraB
MGLFRRRSPRPRPSNGLSPLDAQLVTQLRTQGTDLDTPRHVLHYSYFADRDTAEQAAAAAGAQGWSTTVGEPLEQFPDQWPMRAERPDVVLSDDVVRASTEFFEGLAAAHGGEYDGWEAAAG